MLATVQISGELRLKTARRGTCWYNLFRCTRLGTPEILPVLVEIAHRLHRHGCTLPT